MVGDALPIAKRLRSFLALFGERLSRLVRSLKGKKKIRPPEKIGLPDEFFSSSPVEVLISSPSQIAIRFGSSSFVTKTAMNTDEAIELVLDYLEKIPQLKGTIYVIRYHSSFSDIALRLASILQSSEVIVSLEPSWSKVASPD